MRLHVYCMFMTCSRDVWIKTGIIRLHLLVYCESTYLLALDMYMDSHNACYMLNDLCIGMLIV